MMSAGEIEHAVARLAVASGMRTARITVRAEMPEFDTVEYTFNRGYVKINCTDRFALVEIGAHMPGFRVTDERAKITLAEPVLADFGAWRSIVGQLEETAGGSIGFVKPARLDTMGVNRYEPSHAFRAAGVDL